MSRTARTVAGRLLLVAGLAGLLACGGDDGESEEAGGAPSSTTAAAGGGSSEAVSGLAEVEIVDFGFEPTEVAVIAETTVRWTNQDDATHTVADRTADVESEDLRLGGTFERTFDEPGEFPYVCGIHNYMTGTVTVE